MKEKIMTQTNIIRFPARRGRPRKHRPQKDLGTLELQKKRERAETTEALDLCLMRGLITPQQHWCGIHWRWLYTLRHGAPGVRVSTPTHIAGLEIKEDDPTWREAREEEYREALARIGAAGCAIVVTNICVHNERPAFLDIRSKKLLEHAVTLERFVDGLDVLAKHWKKK